MLLPWQFHEINKNYLITNEAGSFFYCNEKTLNQLINKNIDPVLKTFLKSKNFFSEDLDDSHWNNYLFNLYKRKSTSKKINYMILVPTLRCNLKCSYCQVSRVDIDKSGYDWGEEEISNFENFIIDNEIDNIKIEFQGGEPSLVPHILKKIVDIVEKNTTYCEFVICSNLSYLNQELLDLYEKDNFYISTSLDGKLDQHQTQRTENLEKTNQFFENFNFIIKTYGINKLSALPTITDFNKIDEIINEYVSHGFKTIFLRPVNYQGFARKQFQKNAFDFQEWNKAYINALNYIFDFNYSNEHKIKEFNFENALKRIFHVGTNGYIDLRSPNIYGKDFIVIDYDGKFYPSDESRMMTRIGLIDLNIGSLENGFDNQKLSNMNLNNFNEIDPDCLHCAYQQYCGIDNIDSISRYGTTDISTHDKYFCKTNMFYFDTIFKKIYDKNPKDIFNINGFLTDIFSTQNHFSNIFYYD